MTTSPTPKTISPIPKTTSPGVNLWSSAEHALDYLRRADSIPHRAEGEATLLEFVPADARRVL
jgi:tRNA (cmo5U34)-methyltransferase